MVHVLHATDHLHVLRARGDRMAGLGKRLKRRATEPIDRRGGRRERQARHQRHGAGHVAPEFAPLLRGPEDDVFDCLRGDSAPLNDRPHHRSGEFVAADVAEDSLRRMRPADRGAAAADHDWCRGCVTNGG